MPVFISMLRGVNVGGHNKIKMDALRDLYSSNGLRDPKTYLQSGNVVFRTNKADETAIAKRIQDGIENTFGFRPEAMLRSASEMRSVIAANPFANRKNMEPNKLIVSFLSRTPASEIREKINSIKADPEEIRLHGRELYIYFPDGMGRSKLVPVLDRILKTCATARNWNSVTKMLEIAEHLEADQ
jgi:uncharacterized protein (DUF1697 family)